jgi:hypothetical protein
MARSETINPAVAFRHTSQCHPARWLRSPRSADPLEAPQAEPTRSAGPICDGFWPDDPNTSPRLLVQTMMEPGRTGGTSPAPMTDPQNSEPAPRGPLVSRLPIRGRASVQPSRGPTEQGSQTSSQRRHRPRPLEHGHVAAPQTSARHPGPFDEALIDFFADNKHKYRSVVGQPVSEPEAAE